MKAGSEMKGRNRKKTFKIHSFPAQRQYKSFWHITNGLNITLRLKEFPWFHNIKEKNYRNDKTARMRSFTTSYMLTYIKQKYLQQKERDPYTSPCTDNTRTLSLPDSVRQPLVPFTKKRLVCYLV